MDLIITLQIVFIILMFVLNLMCVLIPIKIIPKDPNKLMNRKSQRIISWCGCISGGVFLATCFIQLIPYIDHKFTKVFLMMDDNEIYLDYTSLTTQSTVMAGFFLILIIEQTIQVWQDHQKQNKPPKYKIVRNVPGEVIELPDGYIASSDSSLSEESDIDDPKKSMLKKSSPPKNTGLKSNSVSPKGGSNQMNNHSHGHSHGGEMTGAHGHSHILDVVQENHGLRCFLLLTALSIHSLFEGMAVGLQESVMALINLFIGVLLHECLIAFSIGVSLAQQQSHLKRGTIIKLSIVFSLMIPTGMVIGLCIGGMHGFAAELTSAILQGIAAGTFVYVIFFEILPAEIASKEDRLLKVLFMFIGFGVILCLQFSMTEHH